EERFALGALLEIAVSLQPVLADHATLLDAERTDVRQARRTVDAAHVERDEDRGLLKGPGRRRDGLLDRLHPQFVGVLPAVTGGRAEKQILELRLLGVDA